MAGAFSFRHEKLDVYRRAVAFIARADDILYGFSSTVAVSEHLDRAAESVVTHIISGNALRGGPVRQHQFEIACGSALECAACLDVCRIKRLVQPDQCHEDKLLLRRTVQMLVGLIRSSAGDVHEQHGRYEEACDEHLSNPLFGHERLEVYGLALKFVSWADALIHTGGIGGRRSERLDVLSTSVVLNIAEGNGRFLPADHRQFIDIAYQSALKAAVLLDVMSVKAEVQTACIEDGRGLLVSIVKLLLGMRGYLEGEA